MLKIKNCLIIIFSLLYASEGISAQKTASEITIDSLPESQIDIPIQINLRPIYAIAERHVDTVFTSPQYPDGWIQANCATRYKYHFRRSPLKISMNETTLNLAFMGYYQIIGSTRACMNGTVLSPWAPSCRCGFDEAERRVNIAFSSTFRLQPNYLLRTTIIRSEPQALDKCSVCFWGQDITTTVINGLKKELDASKKAMEDSFSMINLRPYIQQAWNKMSDVYAIPGVGYFTLHPKKLRMENINAKNDLLNINLGISASPLVSFARPDVSFSPVPDLSTANNPGGFNIYLEAALQYDSLSRVMNSYMWNKRFDFNEGFVKNHIIIQQTEVSGDTLGNLVLKVDFTGSFNGTAFFKGKPSYNTDKKSIEVIDMDYDLRTKNILLNTAKWLFNKRILAELKNYTTFSLANYYDTASKTLNDWLNREWTKGIRGSGAINDLKLTSVYALPQHLLIRSNCVGKLNVMVSEIDLKP
jgi:hypothetical protein